MEIAQSNLLNPINPLSLIIIRLIRLIRGLFFVSQYSVAVFARTDAPGVDHVAHEDTTVANFTRMCYFCYHRQWCDG